MVSNRCITAVKQELRAMELHFVIVDLGKIEIMEDLSPAQLSLLKTKLNASGLELMDDKKALLIEQIDKAINEMIESTNALTKVNYTDYISQKVDVDYAHLSTIFSEVKGITMQEYIINRRIERVKELLLYGDLSLTQISNQMHYSSVAHLSTQFKKVTGLPASHFMRVKDKRKPPISKPNSTIE